MKSIEAGLYPKLDTKVQTGKLTRKSETDTDAFLDAISAEAKEKIEKQKSPAEQLQACRVMANSDILPPDYILLFKGVPICSLGDFSLIIGKAKSRKTLVAVLFLAAMLAKEQISQFEVLKYPNKLRIIWFDTEQSKYHAQRALKNVLSIANSNGSYLEMYSLRPFSPDERVSFIEEAIINQNPENDISLVIIDGIRDLITDINNPDQATSIATKLMKWTESKHLHIITILHQNKGDNNARGHVGTELVNKAQTVISVEVDKNNKDISNVNPEQTRDRPFEPFTISHDQEGHPFIGDAPISQKNKKESVTPHSYETTFHINMCEEVFKAQESYKYSELVLKIKLAFDAIGRPIGDNKAKLMLGHWVGLGLIKDHEESRNKSDYRRAVV